MPVVYQPFFLPEIIRQQQGIFFFPCFFLVLCKQRQFRFLFQPFLLAEGNVLLKVETADFGTLGRNLLVNFGYLLLREETDTLQFPVLLLIIHALLFGNGIDT